MLFYIFIFYRAAIQAAKNETSKPSIIKIRTVIGYGSTKQGTGTE